MSGTTYFSTQSATSSEDSKGISPIRTNFNEGQKPRRCLNATSTASMKTTFATNKGNSRLFNMSLCPPIDPKAVFSPPLEASKSFMN